MNTIVLTAGAVAIAFSATQAWAAPALASPKQPIPYSQLSTYLKASPKQQATKDWSAAAAMRAGVNTSATTAATPSLLGDTAVVPPSTDRGKNPDPSKPPSLAVNPPIEASPSTTVNPPTISPGAPPSTSPPK